MFVKLFNRLAKLNPFGLTLRIVSINNVFYIQIRQNLWDEWAYLSTDFSTNYKLNDAYYFTRKCAYETQDSAERAVELFVNALEAEKVRVVKRF